MKTETLTPKLHFKKKKAILFFFLMLSFSCSKKRDIPPPSLPKNQESNILNISSSKEKFENWAKLVVNKKFGSDLPFSITSVNLIQSSNFKLSEVQLDVNAIKFNFFVGTAFDFTERPQLNSYSLKKNDFPSISRTLIFSSGKNSSNIIMKTPSDSTFTFTTTEKNLFYLSTF